MNKAILKYSLLLKLSQIGWFEIFWLFGMFGAGLAAGGTSTVNDLIAGISHPACVFYVGWSFSRDSVVNRNSLENGEYFSLLFTRPITRASYVLTKTFVTWIGCLLTVFALLSVLSLGELIGKPAHPYFPDGWQCLSIVASAGSFSCLIIMLRMLPPKLGEWMLLMCLMGTASTAFSFDIKVVTPAQQVMMQGWEFASAIYHQLFFPALDAQVVFERTPFSIVPIVTYISNCLLYLLGAILIINRREFSYAQD